MLAHVDIHRLDLAAQGIVELIAQPIDFAAQGIVELIAQSIDFSAKVVAQFVGLGAKLANSIPDTIYFGTGFIYLLAELVDLAPGLVYFITELVDFGSGCVNFISEVDCPGPLFDHSIPGIRLCAADAAYSER